MKRGKGGNNKIKDKIRLDEKTDWFEKVKKGREPIRLMIQLEKGNPIEFELKTPKRFLAMVRAGYTPQKGTLLKKRGGGLTLALPFEKEVPKIQCLGRSDLTQIQNPLIIAGLDLGLVILATLSIGKGDKLIAGDWGWAGPEIARYFFDQKQFGQRRAVWFKPLKNKATPPNYKDEKFPNLKRRLTNLWRELRRCQRERGAYRNKCRKKGIDHRHKERFWRLISAMKRI